MKAAFLCLVHALIIDLAHVNDDLNTHHIDKETVLKKPVEDLLKASGVDLSNG